MGNALSGYLQDSVDYTELENVFKAIEKKTGKELDFLDKNYLRCLLYMSYSDISRIDFLAANKLHDVYKRIRGTDIWNNKSFINELCLLIKHYNMADKVLIKHLVGKKKFTEYDVDNVRNTYRKEAVNIYSMVANYLISYHGFTFDRLKYGNMNENLDHNLLEYLIDDFHFTLEDIRIMVKYENYVLFYNLCVYTRLKERGFFYEWL